MSTLDKIKELDKQKEKLLAEAKQEALQKAEDAVAELNSLGFQYQLVQSGLSTSGTGKRRTGIRKDVLSAVQSKPSTRAELITSFNADDDKSLQQSISNALAALKKSGELTLNNGTYTAK
ncbi:hypothetical protein ACMA5I_10425 [Paracoccaceae bacterium GXU_MW_L88]